jgi:hypothetical protein
MNIFLEIILIIELLANISFLIALISFDGCEVFCIFEIFNPICNYEEYTQFNWFGIAIITLILNILFLPFAVIYWIYQLFTVGRKNEERGD